MANSAAANLNSNGGSKPTGPGAKKLEEIWVKRVNDPARRSFRVVNKYVNLCPYCLLCPIESIRFEK